MDYGVDSNRTFGLKELLIFTDFLEVPQTRYEEDKMQTLFQKLLIHLFSQKKMEFIFQFKFLLL